MALAPNAPGPTRVQLELLANAWLAAVPLPTRHRQSPAREPAPERSCPCLLVVSLPTIWLAQLPPSKSTWFGDLDLCPCRPSVSPGDLCPCRPSVPGLDLCPCRPSVSPGDLCPCRPSVPGILDLCPCRPSVSPGDLCPCRPSVPGISVPADHLVGAAPAQQINLVRGSLNQPGSGISTAPAQQINLVRGPWIFRFRRLARRRASPA
jgi:hypothetical protein